LHDRGIKNGLRGIRRLGPADIREIEPHATGLAGLHVPETGIVDFRQVCEKLHERLLAMGGEVRLGEKVKGLHPEAGGMTVTTSATGYLTKQVVNCGGLYCDHLARQIRSQLDVRIIPFRGEYYNIRPERKYLVRNLVYPVPDPAFPFLGVHFTRMLGGGVEAGPNAVLALRREGYRKGDCSLSEFVQTFLWPGFWKLARRNWQAGLAEVYRSWSKKAFTKALQRLVPDLVEDDLVAGGAGVRAQACDRYGNLLDDFFLVRDPGVLHVLNAPSPAATASLAIGEQICEELYVNM
jgi:L-2-hydroxyglutarate oxidase